MSVLNTLLYFLHVVAVVFWIGGIGYILFVLMPALPHVALRDRARFMPIILGRFLVVVWATIGILAVSGIYRMIFVWSVMQPGFFSSQLGYVLILKLALAAMLIGIALWVTLKTVPRARMHVSTHLGDLPDAYKCQQCGNIVGGMRNVLQIALAVALVIIYTAVKLRGA